MKEKREKHEKQLIAKEKWKEELDVMITQYGGMWWSEDDLLANISDLTEKEKKIAITAQIKYRKAVLGTKVADRNCCSWVQITEFSTQELEDNLKLILRGLTHENISTRASSVYRQVDERKELINDYVVKKRKATDQMQSNCQEKIQWQDKPELIGKNIYHNG